MGKDEWCLVIFGNFCLLVFFFAPPSVGDWI